MDNDSESFVHFDLESTVFNFIINGNELTFKTGEYSENNEEVGREDVLDRNHVMHNLAYILNQFPHTCKEDGSHLEVFPYQHESTTKNHSFADNSTNLCSKVIDSKRIAFINKSDKIISVDFTQDKTFTKLFLSDEVSDWINLSENEKALDVLRNVNCLLIHTHTTFSYETDNCPDYPMINYKAYQVEHILYFLKFNWDVGTIDSVALRILYAASPDELALLSVNEIKSIRETYDY